MCGNRCIHECTAYRYVWDYVRIEITRAMQVLVLCYHFLLWWERWFPVAWFGRSAASTAPLESGEYIEVCECGYGRMFVWLIWIEQEYETQVEIAFIWYLSWNSPQLLACIQRHQTLKLWTGFLARVGYLGHDSSLSIFSEYKRLFWGLTLT